MMTAKTLSVLRDEAAAARTSMLNDFRAEIELEKDTLLSWITF